MKILKLSKAEMQKIYGRPGIFIMAFLFILVIAASSFIYNLPSRSNGIVSIPGTTVQAIYNHYTSANTSLVESKGYYDNTLDDIVTTVNAYSNASTPVDSLTTAFNSIKGAYTQYSILINSNAPDATIDAQKLQLKNNMIAFKNLYNNLFNQEYSPMLIIEKNHIELTKLISNVETIIVDNNDADNVVILNNLNASDFLNKIEAKIEAIDLFEVSDDLINVLNSYYLAEVNLRLVDINNQIVDFYNSNTLSNIPADLLQIKTLISNYKLTIEEFKQIALNSIYMEVFEGYKNAQVNELIGYTDLNLYEAQESLSRNIYLFENNEFIYNYAHPFTVSSPSNTNPNAFDFAYFTLELFSFLIIIYSVVLGAGMIAGEEADGTMKLLAMRPYKRYKIFLGKLLAALRVATMFLIIGALASLLTGTFLFGVASQQVLAVFNTQFVMVMSPYVMFFIYLCTLFLEILFYTVIAVSISSIFKSYTGAVTISILIYFMSMILAFVSGTNFIKYIPLTNTNLFKYFGSAFVSENAVTGLNALLTPPILLDTEFIFSFTLLATTIIVLLTIALRIFSKRDLR